MTFIINVVGNALVFDRVHTETIYFSSTKDETGYIHPPEKEWVVEGNFYKIIKVRKSNVELCYGYFEETPEKMVYLVSGQWGDGVAVIIDSWDWATRCVWELGLEKTYPFRYIEEHAKNIMDCLKDICENYYYRNISSRYITT
jgi:hypothetical protein